MSPMAPRERLWRAAHGEATDRPPCICPGGMMNAIIRDIMERNVLNKSQIPVIDEDEAEDDEDEDVSDLDDGEVIADPEVDAELYDEDLADDTQSGEDASTEDLIAAATQLVRMENKASIALLQRRLKIGYARAARIMQALEDAGVVGKYNGSDPREVLPVDVPAEG